MTQSRPSDTRQLLVQEAVAALGELTPAGLLSAVGVKEIARRAGVGVTTVYHHFGNVEGFADAVVARIYDPGEFPVEQIAELLGQIRDAPFPSKVAVAMHTAEFDRLTSDPQFRVRLGLWALGGPTIDATYGRFLREVDEALVQVSAQMLAAWGRELRPPFNQLAFVAAHTAMVQGVTVRALADPGALDREQFARLQSGLFLLIGRQIGDRRTLDDRLTELNHMPVSVPKGVSLSAARADTRARILDAAALALAERDRTPTIAEIAQVAGVGVSTVYAQFDGLADIAVHLLRAEAAQLPVVATPGDAPGALRAITAELRTIAEFLHGRTHLLGAYGARLIAGDLPPASPLIERLAGALRNADEHAALPDDTDVEETAEMLLTLLVGRLCAAPGRTPGEVADRVAGLVLPGGARPAVRGPA